LIRIPSICAAAVASLAALPALGQSSSPKPQITFQSSNYDDFLIVAADPDAGTMAGYYNDGVCRFMFRDRLRLADMGQRYDLGEGYDVTSWVPGKESRTFMTELYSRAIGGFRTQITLEPSRNDLNRPTRCRSRMTLDLAQSISNSYLDIRVVRVGRAPMFAFRKTGGRVRLLRTRGKGPRALEGVWVQKTWSAEYRRRGFVSIAWYDEVSARGGMIRERDLFPIAPLPAD
jgi:hypothetical protein